MITKKTIEDAGFLNVEQLEENIFYIKNFLSKEDLSYSENIINNIPTDSWSTLNAEHQESWHNKFYDHNDSKLNDLIKNKINNLMKIVPTLTLHGFNRLLRQSPENNMDAHVDEREDQRNGAIREYALVLYLNDNYDGGNLSYLNLGIQIKPEAGSLMIFKTGPKYLHEVKMVTGNNPRYCLPAFAFSGWLDNHNR